MSARSRPKHHLFLAASRVCREWKRPRFRDLVALETYAASYGEAGNVDGRFVLRRGLYRHILLLDRTSSPDGDNAKLAAKRRNSGVRRRFRERNVRDDIPRSRLRGCYSWRRFGRGALFRRAFWRRGDRSRCRGRRRRDASGMLRAFGDAAQPEYAYDKQKRHKPLDVVHAFILSPRDITVYPVLQFCHATLLCVCARTEIRWKEIHRLY